MHTQGKWEIHREVLNSPQPTCIYGGLLSKTHICDFRKLNPCLVDEVLEQQQANAERICQCVNNFDDLLAACKNARTAFLRHEADDILDQAIKEAEK